ncbi:hypothetical protein FO519_002032 [Halicephalobus sp. NKZ332]|nr:hypothetical protein FO519_002032 [Halicephalobus sp. NKZ332]
MPQGTMPVLEVDGKKICQSQAIMRYLGRAHNLTGRNHLERAIVDSIADLVKDFYNQVKPYYYARLGFGPGDVSELRKEHLIPAAESKLPLFEKYLKDAHSGYYVKSGLTYVDFIVAEFFDILYAMESSIFSPHPALIEHVKRIHSLPTVKKYVEKRPSISQEIKD